MVRVTNVCLQPEALQEIPMGVSGREGRSGGPPKVILSDCFHHIRQHSSKMGPTVRWSFGPLGMSERPWLLMCSYLES